MDYLAHIGIIAGIYSILAMGLNLVVGTAGMVSVGHGALFGMGAYGYGILCGALGLHPMAGLAVSALLVGCAGAILGLPSLRFKGDYLALATFAFALAAHDIFNNLISLTRGPMGMGNIPNLLPESSSKIGVLCLVWGIACCEAVLIRRVLQAPWGLGLRAIGEREEVMILCGKDPTSYKIICFVFSALWCGLAGGLYASYMTFIHPSQFKPMLSILVLCMVIVGGMGRTSGGILGAVLFVLLPEALRFLDMPSNMAGHMNAFCFGAALVLMMLFRPQGLLGKYVSINR